MLPGLIWLRIDYNGVPLVYLSVCCPQTLEALSSLSTTLVPRFTRVCPSRCCKFAGSTEERKYITVPSKETWQLLPPQRKKLRLFGGLNFSWIFAFGWVAGGGGPNRRTKRWMSVQDSHCELCCIVEQGQ